MSAVLAVIGLALLAVGLAMYPRRAEAPAPISENVSVAGDSYVMSHMSYVNYAVDQIGRPDPSGPSAADADLGRSLHLPGASLCPKPTLRP